jgi:hypothetical protein
MHEIPDTDDQDQERERYWPERYKRFLREEFALTLKERLNGGLSSVWQERFAARYPDYTGFLARLADMLIVGAENGADDAFDAVYSAFVLEAPLPQPRRYTYYLWPQPFDEDMRGALRARVASEYLEEHAYGHAYEDHYSGRYRSLDSFVEHVATLIAQGAENGTDEMLARIYRALLAGAPLPPARRYPRRLKAW